jgi:beta-galactosidase beta subunit
MIRDLLDHLEWYVGLDAKMAAVIAFLDRGTVYEQGPGTYDHGSLHYRVVEYNTDEGGEEAVAGSAELQIILEGEELFSLRRGGAVSLVTTNTEGMFLLLTGGDVYRHKQSTGDCRATRKVIFSL